MSADVKPVGKPAAMVAARKPRKKDRSRDRLITMVAFVVLIGAWVFGYLNREQDFSPLVPHVLPEAVVVEQRGGVFYGYGANRETLVGYAGIGQQTGYAGPIKVMVGVDLQGNIIGVQVVEHSETPGFFRRLPEAGYFEQFLDKDFADALSLGQDIDVVSGATVSSEAVARAIRDQVRSLGSGPIGAQIPRATVSLQWGAPELVLVALFVAGYFGHRSRKPVAKKWIRRATLITGALVLGFLFNKPLTVSHFTSLLAGYWPDWHTSLYWFLLLGGILFVTTAQSKNPYCSWFCPFGAVQEGLGRIGGAKLYRPRNLHQPLKWAQRALAFSAVALGLALRQPAATSYEPFGTLFDFTGSTPQWFLLAIILLASLLIYRPFCTFVCPMDPIVDYIGEGRRIVQSTWRNWRSS